MKLIIQVPCFNEEESLPATLLDLPKEIAGIDTIETLIIDDGSQDRTAEVARRLGANHVVMLPTHKGLARAFAAGIDRCLELGADIIVNTDGDNQYSGQDISLLVRPILAGQADMVIGDRSMQATSFSWSKRLLLFFGSLFVRLISKTIVRDVVSGFRAYSLEAALRINIITDYSYTLENLIQLSFQKIKITSVPIRTNPVTRKSRLIRSIPHFVLLQLVTVIRVYATYMPLKFFFACGILLIIPGAIGLMRHFLFSSRGNLLGPTPLFSALFLLIGLLLSAFGIIADLNSRNRVMIEKGLYKIRKLEQQERRKKIREN